MRNNREKRAANSYLNKIEAVYSCIFNEVRFVMELVTGERVQIQTDFNNSIISNLELIPNLESDSELGIGAIICNNNDKKIIKDRIIFYLI